MEESKLWEIDEKEDEEEEETNDGFLLQGLRVSLKVLKDMENWEIGIKILNLER